MRRANEAAPLMGSPCRALDWALMVSEYTRAIARPRFRDDQLRIDVDPREPFVPVITHQPLRRGVVRAKRTASIVWAAWTLQGALC